MNAKISIKISNARINRTIARISYKNAVNEKQKMDTHSPDRKVITTNDTKRRIGQLTEAYYSQIGL